MIYPAIGRCLFAFFNMRRQAIVPRGLSKRLSFALCNERLPIRVAVADVILGRPVPGWNLMPPPELAGNAPGLDAFHPVEIGRLPIARHKHGASLAYCLHRGLREPLGADVPLIGEKGLYDDSRAVAMGHRMGVRLYLRDLVRMFER